MSHNIHSRQKVGGLQVPSGIKQKMLEEVQTHHNYCYMEELHGLFHGLIFLCSLDKPERNNDQLHLLQLLSKDD